MQNTHRPPLPNHQVLAVAVEAKADPRTVRKLLLGRNVQPQIRDRIERALRILNVAVAPMPAQR
jgi:hypothetical protein